MPNVTEMCGEGHGKSVTNLYLHLDNRNVVLVGYGIQALVPPVDQQNVRSFYGISKERIQDANRRCIDKFDHFSETHGIPQTHPPMVIIPRLVRRREESQAVAVLVFLPAERYELRNVTSLERMNAPEEA